MNTVDFSSFLPLILVFAAMYFFVIRPQSKKNKEHKAMLDALQPKDRVLTSGGLIGNIHSLSETEVRLELAPGVVVSILRTMIAQKVPNAPTSTPKTTAAKPSPKAPAKPKEKSKDKPKPSKAASKPATKKPKSSKK